MSHGFIVSRVYSENFEPNAGRNDGQKTKHAPRDVSFVKEYLNSYVTV